MKILHILDHSVPIYSGYSFRTLAILKEQQALGWETVQVTGLKHTVEGPPVERVEGFEFHRTTQSWRVLRRLPLLGDLEVIRSLSRRVSDVARQVQPDIVHAHSPSLNGVAALHVSRRLRVPLVYEVRASWEDGAVAHGTARNGGWKYRASRALETYVLRRCDAVTTICEGLRRDIIGRGVPEGRVTVIPNAVDAGRFAVAPAPTRGLADALGVHGGPLLGFIGSFYGYEGLPVLLQAVPMIATRYPRLRVVLVGGGDQEQALKRLVSELGISAHVVFTGWVPHETVDRYYQLIDVFVYPRLRNRLTELVTPLKPLEAMAKGRLVVASDVGGHRELIRHGDTGLLFEAGNPAALAAVVLDALEQRDRTRSMCETARRFVESERTWAASVARYAAVYEKIVERRGATGTSARTSP